jgi:hypothetical protein
MKTLELLMIWMAILNTFDIIEYKTLKKDHHNAVHCSATKWVVVAVNGLVMNLHFQLNYPNSLMKGPMK